MMRARSLIAATLAVAATAATGCGDDPVPTACVGLDATNPAIDSGYLDELRARLDEAARDERDIRVLLFRGDPLSEGRVIQASFHGLASPELQVKRRQAVNRVSAGVEDQLEDIRVGIAANADGSAVVDAIKLLTTSRQVCSTLDLYSDGLERVRFSVYDDPIGSPADRDRIATRLRREGALPNLKGLVVRMPYGGYVMGSSRLERARKAALEPLWTAVVERSGGKLEWGA